ncbi:PilZ domain-containing protein [Endozoicomonas sp. SM1973]|uniref:PilZ domain-containing protein n=1 Tax=Spartinivicinus marinus TaxID=2994442 RepID=A0A853IH98_9GAMM|nr:PilZ domain-containing protein [Spartinivicinus marinus]MCX4028236.1 PilZ domain-containing protein [Spartinivicinus marinus]NYZ69404.1 PilZ domain-containing protein [Spartinivicinus marinus]
MEKRQLLRTEAIQPVNVYDTLSGDCLGALVNISTEGFMLITTKPLPVSRLYQCQIKISFTAGGKDTIDLAAELLWLKGSNTPEHSWAGFQVIDISEHGLRQVQQLVELLEQKTA